jgi:hypothetical protein
MRRAVAAPVPDREPLVFVGAMAVLSVFCWTVVVGKIESIRG